MKKQFKINSLKVKSFVTNFADINPKTIQGGKSGRPTCKYGTIMCTGDTGYQNTREPGCSDLCSGLPTGC